MKTPKEIHEKIEELFDKKDATDDPVMGENICNQIDALLWAIGDKSGKEI